MTEITQILQQIEAGEAVAAERLFPLVYDELKRLAVARLKHEQEGNTLNPTALVHEAYLRLVGDQQFENRRHFFAAAAEAMRRILVENARRKHSLRRGGGRERIELEHLDVAAPGVSNEILDLDEALTEFAAADP